MACRGCLPSQRVTETQPSLKALCRRRSGLASSTQRLSHEHQNLSVSWPVQKAPESASGSLPQERDALPRQLWGGHSRRQGFKRPILQCLRPLAEVKGARQKNDLKV